MAAAVRVVAVMPDACGSMIATTIQPSGREQARTEASYQASRTDCARGGASDAAASAFSVAPAGGRPFYCEKVSSIPKYGHYHASLNNLLHTNTVTTNYWNEYDAPLFYQSGGHLEQNIPSSGSLCCAIRWPRTDLHPPRLQLGTGARHIHIN